MEYHRCVQRLRRTWTEFATFLRHANLFARRTRQWWASGFRVEPLAGETPVETVALDAMFRRDFLAVIIDHAAQVALLYAGTHRGQLGIQRSGFSEVNKLIGNVDGGSYSSKWDSIAPEE